MFHTIALYVALGLSLIGCAFKVSSWFRRSVGLQAKDIPASRRVTAALRGILLTLFSRKIATLAKVFFRDVLLQWHLFRQDRLRWAAHMAIFGGFMLLLGVHALDHFITARLVSNYAPTLNPFRFLRDLAGVIVLAGVVLALYRRFLRRGPRPATSIMDAYAIAILAVIMLSGVLLEGAKMVSHATFQSMVDEYAMGGDEESAKDLESYWVAEFGMASPNVQSPVDAATLERGKEQHEMNCQQCHANPRWGFAGFGTGALLRPLGDRIDQANLPGILWAIHFYACLIGLAYLPFSKMFHIFVAPLSLLANAVMDRRTSDPANIATRQVMELDACTHCGACTARCSMAVAINEIPNIHILPSEKIPAIKALVAGKTLDDHSLRALQQGMHLCTTCSRCTSVCPSGINLTDLWFNVRERLLEQSVPEPLLLSPLSLYRSLMKETLAPDQYESAIERAIDATASGCDMEKVRNQAMALVPGNGRIAARLNGSLKAKNFSNCYRCMTCSVSCPVVRNYERPADELGLLPHQLMYAVGLRMWDLVFSSKMLWSCLGCYQCQENCPQCVGIADVIYELKNVAIAQTLEADAPVEASKAKSK